MATHTDVFDKILFIGFTKPESRDGMVRLINATGVDAKNLVFHPDDGELTPQKVLKDSFIPDSSAKYKLRIGHSLAIISGGLPQQRRLVFERLSVIDELEVRSGYQHINFDGPLESELTMWFTTGSYSPEATSSDGEYEGDDFLSSLLGGSSQDAAAGEDESSTTGDHEAAGGKDVADVSVGGDEWQKEIDAIDGDEGEGASPLSSIAQSMTVGSMGEMVFPSRGEGSSGGGGVEGSEGARPAGTVSPARTQPQQPQQPTPPPPPNTDTHDDDELIRKSKEQRREAEEKRRTEQQQRLDKKNEALEKLKQLKQSSRNTSPENDLINEARDLGVERITHGGSRTFRDYLSSEDQKEQRIAEDIRKDFGNLDSIVTQESRDLGYVGRGIGRVILCTAGKGGVGKSLISAGMASALSLARAKQRIDNPGTVDTARVFLIESDYNSPQLAAAYGIRHKHLGNVARVLASTRNSNEELQEAIENNIHVDPETGVHILACPPLASGDISKHIQLAIVAAVRYGSKNGDDVIIDHGNLTAGEYSTLDKVLAMKEAHRVVIVCNMGCIDETQSALAILTQSRPDSSVRPRPVPSVSVVLNSARKEQFYIAQEKLAPFQVVNVLPPFDALRAENSLTGDTYFSHAPHDVRKAVIDRCGVILTKIGYTALNVYFVKKTAYMPKKPGKNGLFGTLRKKLFKD